MTINRYPFINGYQRNGSLFKYQGQAIDAATFAREVAVARGRLNHTRYVINACHQRLSFAIAFAAALLDGQTTLLPPDNNIRTFKALRQTYANPAVVTDRPLARFDDTHIESITPLEHTHTPLSGATLDTIAPQQTAVIVHTSGSTGTPTPHAKTWGQLVQRARTVATRFDLKGHKVRDLTATVPSQHMYALENVLMLALQSGLRVTSAHPFLPSDVLAHTGSNSLLVTTPLHLRAITQHTESATAALVLSSTAPLSTDLATRAEQQFKAPVMEIYGSTETGVIATRRTRHDAAWQPLDTIRIESTAHAHWFYDEYDHKTQLNDTLKWQADGRFMLGERNSDIVKVAGKRTSLAALERALCELDGVEDGAFVAPDNNASLNARLTAFVVAPDVDEKTLLQQLRTRIEGAFMPRPLIKVTALPRNATGKLPRAALKALRRRLDNDKLTTGC